MTIHRTLTLNVHDRVLALRRTENSSDVRKSIAAAAAMIIEAADQGLSDAMIDTYLALIATNAQVLAERATNRKVA